MILSIGLIGVSKLFVYVHILLVYLYFNLYIVIAVNNLTTTQTVLQDPATILSKNGNFMLGFFSPSNTKNRYLGIWYNHVSVTNYIWVANRDHPIVDNSGVLRISKDGNLQVLSGGVNILWSTNISSPQSDNKTSRDVKLEDSGNLVLQDPDGNVIWQSFDHPTDSILPNMTLKLTSSNMKNALQSWKSPSDPSIGRFSLGTDSMIHPQVVIWDGDKKYWRSGPWNGNLFLGLVYADPSNNYADTSIQNFGPEEAHLIYTGINTLEFSHYVFDSNGRINENYWDSSGKGWKTVYRAPDVECDVYGTCGVFGTCNPEKYPMCRCLKGFSPMNSEEWSNGNWSSGCVRNNPLLCGDEAAKDGFLMLSTVKLPDFAVWLKGLNPNDCRKQCLENCSCLGYTYDNGAGCLYWNTDLIDIQELKMSGVSLYIRLSHLDLAGNRTKVKGIIAAVIISNAAFIALFIFFLRKYLKCRKDKANKRMLEKQRMRENRSGPVERELKELPYYEFQDLLVATNNFHEQNKLGHGGFGQVYKGKMEDGQEIAVKRLSTAHGQGSEEFVNEVVVISGLQHMNLVRLLGFCTQGEEKILVYEYMPNRSLDAFLFDPTKQQVLNWDKRFNIIEGICRGLVYLHRDSRVRIIHRDLKASNILLDKDLNAKISDFGMARIFGRYQDQEETRRIVGTFGYMAPEYTLEGNFSEKSDVYSFGVLMLEIVTGKRNNAFWCEDQSLTLLGYVWNFWVDGNVGPVLDPVISHPFFRTEIEKCIQIGLLCVQEFVRDRPTMSTVVAMLGSDNADLPIPKKPGFTQRLTASDSDSTQMLKSSSSTNHMSFTGIIAR